MRQPVFPRFIPDSKGLDHFATGVRKQRKRDFPPLGKPRENIDGVIAHPDDLESGLIQLQPILLQFN